MIKISKTDFRDMDEAHFYFYIKRMVKNHAVTEYRRMERAGDLASIFSSSIDPYKMAGVDWGNRLLPPEMTLARWREDPSNTLQTLIEREETDQALLRTLKDLALSSVTDPRDRMALEMGYSENVALSRKEIATRCGMTPEQLKVRLYRARKKMGEYLLENILFYLLKH